jgi:hypothetical protein
MKMASSQQRRWEEETNAMKERKKNKGLPNDSEKLKRRYQVAVTKLRTGYTDCPFCSTKITLEHILWLCKETEEERRECNMTKEVWEKGKEGAKMLVEYVKNIGLYFGL